MIINVFKPFFLEKKRKRTSLKLKMKKSILLKIRIKLTMVGVLIIPSWLFFTYLVPIKVHDVPMNS